MRCRDVEEWLAAHASGGSIPPEAAAHIAGCEQCTRLARSLADAGEAAPPSRDRLEQIEAGILADLKQVTPLPRGRTLLFVFVIALAVVVLAGAAVLGLSGWRALSLPQRLVVFTALTAAIGFLAFSAERQIVPGSRLVVSPALLVVAALAAMIGIVGILFHPHQEATFVATGVVCLRIGLECGAAAGVLLWLLLTRGAILRPMITGATAGALAGFTGLTVLELMCPDLNEYHVLVWHLGALMTSAAAGLAIGAIVEYSGAAMTRRSKR